MGTLLVCGVIQYASSIYVLHRMSIVMENISLGLIPLNCLFHFDLNMQAFAGANDADQVKRYKSIQARGALR
jgi:hypothetical protein